jgi:DeoR/GlpR family transcriptional regulator of sugar metabolism
MFGSKQGKEERLERIATLLEQEELTPAQIARKIGVHRSTISEDLVDLENRGEYLQEDEGKLSIFRRKK